MIRRVRAHAHKGERVRAYELDLERGLENGDARQELSIPLARPGPANKKETGSLGRGGIGCQWPTDA
jgi:hypothetical protein